MPMSRRLTLLPVLSLLLCVGAAQAQPALPKPPDKYKALIRYRIIAPRDPHVAMYDALIAHLKGLGFEFIPPLEKHRKTDREDPSKDRLVGLVPSSKALAMLNNPNVAGLVLMPEKLELPEDPDAPLRVRLELTSGLTPDRQRELADQVRAQLRHVIPGFKEAVAYDHRGYTGRPFSRLVGTIPRGQLDLLLKDLRRLPTGWLTGEMEDADFPSPLGSNKPIVVTEVLGVEPLVEAPADVREEAHLYKITPDLWKALEDKTPGPVRVEIILTVPPAPFDESWRQLLARVAPTLFIESQHGAYVIGLMSPEDVRGLATSAM